MNWYRGSWATEQQLKSMPPLKLAATLLTLQLLAFTLFPSIAFAQPGKLEEPQFYPLTPVADQAKPELPAVAPNQANNRLPLQGNAKFDGPIETSGTLLTGRAGSAPGRIYKAWLEEAHPQFALGANAIADDRLVVITDRYDQAERTLKTLGLPFKSMEKRELDSYDLTNAQVLVIDCGPKNLSYAAGMKIREFVIRGGYLITTDWMLDRLDQKIFPGYIAWNGAMNTQRMYDATIVGKDPVLFRHAVTRANWKMDIHCHLIRVINKDLVRVLAVSPTLAKDDPDGQGILAVVFPFEKGYVMHMTAHFDRSQSGSGDQIDDPAPVIGIGLRQAIAINFVVAGLSGTKL
ncbi:MAG: hypothetical protein QG574_3501 [Cyanobacteriota bacterium erpe_2018_sw_21hr_WHONDRS-SW48-000092_B_bin.40]|jgi:hypothetical protein|nr:hypothetical protein [Cyanobacteriota bacterium erpe_2018_sw_21hr_WHONDRS-SW48-000092_B_bin.40]